MKKCLGWDCAYKTLAWSYITVDTQVRPRLSAHVRDFLCLAREWSGDARVAELIRDDDFREIYIEFLAGCEAILEQFIQFHSAGVVDILGGRALGEVDDVGRARALRSFLRTIEIARGTHVMIEHQPRKIGKKTNTGSTAVEQQLVFHYLDHPVTLVNPKLKCGLALRDGLTLADFPRASAYESRKAHSRANFMYLVEVFECEGVTAGVPRKHLDDLADSAMQILAYLVENKMFE